MFPSKELLKEVQEMTKKVLIILALCCILGLAGSVHAVTIRHLGVSTAGQDVWLKDMARRFEEETGINPDFAGLVLNERLKKQEKCLHMGNSLVASTKK
jgi:ABC-type glycerol-3-phosphate transport system substrate-binding protein